MQFSMTIVFRSLSSLASRRPTPTQLLPRNRRTRLILAPEYKHSNTGLFTDESPFALTYSSGQERIWKLPRGEIYAPSAKI